MLRPRKGIIVGASTRVRRRVLDTAPINPAAAAIFTGLLNITEYANEAHHHAQERKGKRRKAQWGKVVRRQANTLGNHPTYEGRHHNNRYGI